MQRDYFGAQTDLQTGSHKYTFYRLSKLEQDGLLRLEQFPFSIKILLESLLRQCNENEITRQDVIHLAGWQPQQQTRPSLPYLPGRVIMQDFTGVAAAVDLAALASAMRR